MEVLAKPGCNSLRRPDAQYAIQIPVIRVSIYLACIKNERSHLFTHGPLIADW
jgi:hypothetical protein